MLSLAIWRAEEIAYQMCEAQSPNYLGKLIRKPMKTLLLAIGFSLLLSACGAESDAKKAVLGSLKDPDSAKFGKFTQVEKSACLTVNARNAMGGYTGDQQATLMQVNKEWVVSSIGETSHDTCISSLRYLEQVKKLAETRACTACHTIDEKGIGPAWMEISKKYKGDATAKAKLSEKVAKGGSGVWGETPMPANPEVTPAEMEKLVGFIMGLAK